jgi:pimeloyl-ACP methyl ester carboxylesterase
MARQPVLPILSLLALGLAPPAVTAGGARVTTVAVQAAPPVAPPTLPPQRATFIVFVQGIRMGNETLDVVRADGGWLIRSSGRLQPPVDLTLNEAEIRYDAELKPRSLRLSGFLRGRALDLTTTFEGGVARNTFGENGVEQTTQVVVSADTIVLPNNVFGAYAVLAARLARSAKGTELRAYVAPQVEIAVALNDVANERIQTPARSFGVRRHRVTLRNPGTPLDVEIETEEDGTLLRVSIPAVRLQVVREDVASVAARQQRFVREGDENVTIPANGFNIAATISRPSTIPPPPPRQKVTRLPAILLVPGSGAVDRDEVVAGIPVFGQLAAGLADAGFLVVRYDKRGVGQSGGREEAATLQDYAEDVIAAVKWLEKRKDVDPKRITVVGHSEGAAITMLAASREKRIVRIVLVAAPGTTGAALVLEQQQSALAKSTLSEEEKRRRVDLQHRIHAAVLEGGGWQGVPEELRRQADTPWFSSLLAFDPAAVMRRIRQPILIVAGERDRQVPAHHAEQLATLARARKNSPPVAVVTVPGVNHLLVPATSGEVEEYVALSDRSVSPAVVTAIASWIAK